jgi:hypothetical protein
VGGFRKLRVPETSGNMFRNPQGHDALPRAAFGSKRFDQREVSVPLPVLGSLILAKQHPCLHPKCGTDSAPGKQPGLHYNAIRSTDYAGRYRHRRSAVENR